MGMIVVAWPMFSSGNALRENAVSNESGKLFRREYRHFPSVSTLLLYLYLYRLTCLSLILLVRSASLSALNPVFHVFLKFPLKKSCFSFAFRLAVACTCDRQMKCDTM